MLNFFTGEPVTIQRKTFNGVDKYGVESFSVSESLVGAIVAYKNSTRTVANEGIKFDTQINLIFPEGTDLRHDDTFIVRGEKWETDGWYVPLVSSIMPNDFLPADVHIPVKRIKQ